MRRSVLVTGGAGYIGAHTCKALRRAGFLPVTMDDLSLGHESFVKWGPLVRSDLRAADAVRRAIEAHGVEAVIHFAASAQVAESVGDPAKYYANNVVSTLSLLDGMRAAGCDRIVFSSTCGVYGQPETVPVGETAPERPVSPYGRSKLVCERILQDYAAAYGMRQISLRYFNAAGADVDAEVGELRDPESHLIPRALMALLGWLDDFQVFGNDFPTPDGTAVRDYVHVADLAEAHVSALRRLLAGGDCGVFNLGSGRGVSVGEVLRTISAVTRRPVPAPVGPRRPGDPAMLVADIAQARAVLGFDPQLSDLRTIIGTAWAWHAKAHPLKAARASGGARGSTSFPAQKAAS